MMYNRYASHSVFAYTTHLVWAIGYDGWSSGNVTNEMIDEYLEHHRNPSNADSDDTFINPTQNPYRKVGDEVPYPYLPVSARI